MNKEKFIEQAHLYLMDELNENERIEFENLILEDNQLHKEFDSVKELYNIFTENRPYDVDEQLLVSARASLMRNIRLESSKQSIKNKIAEWLKNIFITNYRFALGGFGMLMVGVFVGYLFFSTPFYKQNIVETSRGISLDNFESIERNDVKISNIRIPTTTKGGAEIEISFDAIKPISYKGTADDPFIQRLLANALVTESNPGLRLRTINTIAEQAESITFKQDPKIKTALITALKVDENPAVRREALNLLMKYPFDEEIRDAFLFSLSNDKNSGMRVAAINALAQLKIEGTSLDEKIINVLNRKAEQDESDFIRLRAASLVKEVNYYEN